MNRFEQLIEYVINDDEQKARELFHDIVVEKSRQIYEDIMAEEAEEIEEGADEELDEMDMGGDASNDLIDDVEMEEESDMNMEAEGDDDMGDDDMGDDDMGDDDMGDDDMGGMGGDDMGGMGDDEPATKDDIMNLEDKLDQLMAEFEDLMGDNDDMGGDGDMMGPDEGGDALEMDDTEEMGMMEALELKAAPKPVTSEEGNTNKKSTVAANSGARGAMAKPVHTGADGGGHHDSSAYKNTVKDFGVTPTQDAGKKAFKSAAPAPVKTQAAGVNARSPLPRN
jgi:hypothetical protein